MPDVITKVRYYTGKSIYHTPNNCFVNYNHTIFGEEFKCT